MLSQITRLSSAAGDEPVENHLAVIDYRRNPGLPTAGPAIRSANDPEAAADLCRALAGELASSRDLARRPGHPQARTRRRQSETAPRQHLWLAVDDLDLVVTPMNDPLRPVLPFLALGRDIGFHLIVTRRTGGLSRAQYEPLLQTLTDLATPTLLLSGSPAEGRLGHGLVPSRLPTGRAQWATRAGQRVLQVAVVDTDAVETTAP